MIHFITGLPGTGKTLYMLQYVHEQLSNKGERPVYYSGINDLKLPWIALGPLKDHLEHYLDEEDQTWKYRFTVPPNAIIVIDECQRVYRPRGNGATVPDEVAALETHRHSGVDIVLSTQHPMLCDSNVRRLVGRHFHGVRMFGTQATTWHEWAECKVNCDQSRADSVKHIWKYPKEYFGLYKSAEVHTHKARIPARVWMMIALPLILAALVYGFYSWMQPKTHPVAPGSPGAPGAQISGTIAGASSGPRSMTAAEYVESHEPRISGLAYTAPAFDEVTKPVRAPYPAACVIMRGQCRCYSQQGTRLDMPQDLCRSIVDRGFFRSWKEEDPQISRISSNRPSPSSAEQSADRIVIASVPPGRAPGADLGTRQAPQGPQWGGEAEPGGALTSPRVPLSSPAHFNHRKPFEGIDSRKPFE